MGYPIWQLIKSTARSSNIPQVASDVALRVAASERHERAKLVRSLKRSLVESLGSGVDVAGARALARRLDVAMDAGSVPSELVEEINRGLTTIEIPENP